MKTSYILIAVAAAVVLYMLLSKSSGLKAGTGVPSGNAGYITAGAALINAGANAYKTVNDSSGE